MLAALMQMPLIQIVGISWQGELFSAKAHVEVMLGPRDLRILFHQLHHQFHRIHTRGRGESKQVRGLGVLRHEFQGVFAGERFDQLLGELSQAVTSQAGARLPGAGRATPDSVDIDADLWALVTQLAQYSGEAS